MTTDEVRKLIDEENRRFGDAVRRKDYDEIATLYTGNAMVLPPDAPIVAGRAAIGEFWRTTADAIGLTAVTLKTLNLEVSGSTAYEVGEAELTLTSRQDKAKYLVVWQKGLEDSKWRLHRDIWNSIPAK